MNRPVYNPMFWVIGTLLVALLPQLATMAAHLVLLTLLPIAWRLAAEIRHWKPLPTLLRLGITLTTLVVLVATYGSILGRRAAVGLLSVMLALKLLETFRARDARIVVSLSLFLCATQFLFAQGLLMVVYGFACLVAALVAFALIARTEAYATVKKPAPPGRGVLGEVGFGSRLMLLAIPVALALFLFFPRWGSPLWGVPERSLDAKSGLSDTMAMGSIQGLFMDDTPAFRVNFMRGMPQQKDLYWRGPVMWDFDGYQWEASGWRTGLDAEVRPSAASAPYVYEVQLEPHERRWLFALDYPAVKPPEARRLTFDYQLLTRRPVTKLLRYDMASDPTFLDSPELAMTHRRAALALPEDFNPRTRELMTQWRAETSNDAAFVRRALAHFNEQPFRYTLNPPLLSRHSVDEFLFDTRAGFCEHYASAFAVMMRMAGIPSRIVTGYQGGWTNAGEDYMLVRQSDAHAWAEVWLARVGWTRIDPTAAVAPNRIEQGALDALDGRRHLLDFQWLRDLRNVMYWLNRAWNDWVIAFDAGRQLRILDLFGMGNLGAQGLVILLALFLLIGGALVLPWLLRFGRNRERDALVKAWHRFLARLRKAGVPVTRAMGPLEVAAAAANLPGGDAQTVEELAHGYLRVRYASDMNERGTLVRKLGAFRPPRAQRSDA